ncbi:MAG: GyrI-like domain-containing protein [Deltaproteobacteria bacterium]|nr:GyrI-like domain-containing protein [Deltaproteobacteria bacterium]
MRRALTSLVLALAACGHAPPPAAPVIAAPVPADDGIEVLELTAQPALAREIRAQPAALADELGGAIFGLIATAKLSGADPAGPPFARYESRGTAADPTMVVLAGLPIVRAPDTLPEGATVIELPAGPAAAIVHVGRHEDLGQAHAALDAWLVAHHRQAAGPRWEVFLTNPMTTPDPAQQRTKVFAPLAPEARP